jgi:D-methionine transport system substrate-binding protein
MKRRTLATTLVSLFIAAAFGTGAAGAAETLKVGASPVPHADILKSVQKDLQEKGIKLVIVEFQDYVQPNLALADKSLDANYFQHIPYLETFSGERKLNLKSAGGVHVEPIALYSKKVKSLDNIKKGATVGIPNDPTNGGRALLLLSKAGLIELNPSAGIKATLSDVKANPKNLKFKEIDLTVINSNFAIGAGLNPVKDSLVIESSESPYVNIVAVRAGDENKPAIKELLKALHSEKTKKFINEQYKGAVVPAF